MGVQGLQEAGVCQEEWKFCSHLQVSSRNVIVPKNPTLKICLSNYYLFFIHVQSAKKKEGIMQVPANMSRFMGK